MHTNFLQTFAITDGGFEPEVINSDWATDPEAAMQGNEWWCLMEPAYPGIAKWKQVATQNLNILDTIRPTKTMNTFILAVINDALSDDFTPCM